jgi:hypothetical protein
MRKYYQNCAPGISAYTWVNAVSSREALPLNAAIGSRSCHFSASRTLLVATKQSRAFFLFHCNSLSQIPRLVHIRSPRRGRVIREQLQRYDVEYWRQHAVVFGHANHVQAFAGANVRIGIGEHEQLAAVACAFSLRGWRLRGRVRAAGTAGRRAGRRSAPGRRGRCW